MIVASIHGRLRLKISAENSARINRLHQELKQLPEVIEVRQNQRARSLIVTYRLSISKAEMEQKVAQYIEFENEVALPSTVTQPVVKTARRKRLVKRRDINRVAKTAAIVSLPLSVGLIYLGFKRWHEITGWCFVASAATHVFIHRKNIFS